MNTVNYNQTKRPRRRRSRQLRFKVRRCRECQGVLRPYGDSGKWSCERCHRVVDLTYLGTR